MKYLLDTDICIFFLQGKYSLLNKIQTVGIQNCCVSEITILELKFGAANSHNSKKHTKEVDQVESLFSVIPIYDSFDFFAKEKARMRKEGILIPDFDLLIGSTAITNDLLMVTNNERHLKRIEGIQIENWTK